jgi:hypothetical protein
MLTTLIYLIDCVLVHDKSLSDKKAHVVGEFRNQCIYFSDSPSSMIAFLYLVEFQPPLIG